MQYVLSVLHDDPDTAAATEAEMTAIDAYNDRLKADGHWVFAGGLTPPSTATVVDNRDGAGLVVDGPYAESKEYVVGFWIIEAPDLDVALRLANAGSAACHRRVEVRPVR